MARVVKERRRRWKQTEREEVITVRGGEGGRGEREEGLVESRRRLERRKREDVEKGEGRRRW